jgi:hypothetical protein
VSVQATTWVWEHAHVNGNELLVLLAIADAASREGENSCQSVTTLAGMARIGTSTCYRILASLRDEGWVEKTGVHGRYKTNVYRLPHMNMAAMTPPAGETSQIETPPAGETRPLPPVADEPTTYPRTTQEVPSTEVLTSTASDSVAPLTHPARAITHDWAPRAEYIRHLRYLYQRIDLRESARRFVAFHIARQDTSRSWEASFQAWASTDEERLRERTQGGTDDLGVPLNQKRGSSVPEVQPGDPDYVDPEEIIALAISEAQKRPRNKS